MNKNISRRILEIILAMAATVMGSESMAGPVASVVFSARSDQAIDGYKENGPLVRAMVDELVKNVTGKKEVASAWRSLVQPGDRVGIKIAVGGGPVFSTHRELVEAVVAGMAQAGIARKDVIVWDRSDPQEAGFSGNTGYRVRGIEPFSGYNKKAVVNAPVLGRLIWGDLAFTRNRNPLIREPEQVSSESHWSNIISQEVTKIINLPLMVNDENCGIAGALYNVTIPNLDNWRRFVQAPYFGNPYIGELYANEQVGPKVVLTIMDGLIAQYAGGPGFQPDYAFAHRTLYASTDPVAVDAVAFRKIIQWREEAKLNPLKDRAGYLESAEAMELGNFAMNRIEVRELEQPPEQKKRTASAMDGQKTRIP